VVFRYLALALVLLGGCRFDRGGLTAFDTAGASHEQPAVDLAPPAELGVGDGPRDTSPFDQPPIVEGGLEISVPDLPVADLVPTCNPPCPGASVCCDKGGGPTCYASTNTKDCPCDVASGFPCAGTSHPICCDRGSGPRCDDGYWSFSGNCKCIPSTGAPCADQYSLCCDKGTSHRCYKTDDSKDCACNVASQKPCEGNTPICCDKGTGPRCTNSYTWPAHCKCAPVTGAPCGGNTPVCCDKGAGAGFRCYSGSDTKDCACDIATTIPCGSNAPVCCDRGLGPRCTNSYTYPTRCKCNAVTGVPCGGNYPVCCDKGAGDQCFANNETKDCGCDPTSQKPCVGTNYPSCCDVGGGVYRCQNSC
jgi:hypothetical protein